jgi:hypothetical protein
VPNERFNNQSKDQIISNLEEICFGTQIRVQLVDNIEKEKSGKYRIVVSLLSNKEFYRDMGS